MQGGTYLSQFKHQWDIWQRVRNNFRSTKETEPTVDELMNEEEKYPEIITPGKQPLNQENQVEINVIDFDELKGVIATDQTGRFPITS